jgi:hypothetical protein
MAKTLSADWQDYSIKLVRKKKVGFREFYLMYSTERVNNTTSLHPSTMQTYEEIEIQLHEFLMLAHDGSVWLASHSGHFTSKKRTLTPTRQEAGCAPEMVSTMWQRKKPYLPRTWNLVTQ